MRYGDIGDAAPPSSAQLNTTTSQWGPFKSAASYGESMALVICVLFSVFAFALLLMAAAKFLLRRRQIPPALKSSTASRYLAGETELAGSTTTCAICLSEFADGEKVRVLPSCRHGFHAECVEAWWVVSAGGGKPVHRSASPCCPLCRTVVCDTQIVDSTS